MPAYLWTPPPLRNKTIGAIKLRLLELSNIAPSQQRIYVGSPPRLVSDEATLREAGILEGDRLILYVDHTVPIDYEVHGVDEEGDVADEGIVGRSRCRRDAFELGFEGSILLG